MDLILWRHAIAVDADEGLDDLKRPLTEEGEDQAKEMAGWLKRHLPRNTRILTSPALRTRQTVLRLTKTDYRVVNELAPNATPDTLLRVVNWPLSEEPVVTRGRGVPAYFAGLLPEGRRLSGLRRALKTSADDELSLLVMDAAKSLSHRLGANRLPSPATTAPVRVRVAGSPARPTIP